MKISMLMNIKPLIDFSVIPAQKMKTGTDLIIISKHNHNHTNRVHRGQTIQQ